MISDDLEVEIGGQVVDFPLEAFDLVVTSDFGNDAIQPQINIDDITIFYHKLPAMQKNHDRGFFA